MSIKKIINFSSITDNILNRDVEKIELKVGEEHNKPIEVARDRLGVGLNEDRFSTWVLIISEESFTYTKNTLIYHLAASALLQSHDKITIFEFETLGDVMRYLNQYHEGVDYGTDEI